MFHIKRIYDEPASDDGYRVLVDRLWPRGVSRERAGLDDWLKDVAPSPQLRAWFGHVPDRFDAFRTKYEAELAINKAEVQKLLDLKKEHGTVALLYAAHDPDINHAKVLLEYLETEA